jgi:hypothetical protein
VEQQSNSVKMPQVAYVFLDEGGNFDFSVRGTRYFTLTSVLKFRPFQTFSALTSLRYDLIETGLDIEYFHASEDRQAVRNQVFDILQKDIGRFEVDGLIVEKPKTGTALQKPEAFYPRMLGYLLRHVLEKLSFKDVAEVIVITDQIPIQKRRKVIEKAVKQTLKKMLPSDVPYRLLHHSSKSASGLQIADYFNWAIFRAWERDDARSLELVESAVKSQFEIFKSGTRYYYGEKK